MQQSLLLSSERACMQITIVFNPGSGRRAAHRALSDVVAALASHNHTLTVIDCHQQPDFERELRKIAPDLDRVIVIGGDGTLSSVINAVYSSENPAIPVAFVPTGRGKDTARSLPSWTASAMSGGAFERTASTPTDLVKAELENGIVRYAINVSSIGVGAHAAAVAGRLPRVFGSLSYVLGAARGFVPLRPFQAALTIDGEHQEFDNALLIAACNGKSFGGGIYLAPEASQDDGVLDVVVASNANLADLALQLGKLKSGTPFDHPALSRWRAKTIEIDPVNTIHYEADGEALSAQPIRYEIVPRALNWITP